MAKAEKPERIKTTVGLPEPLWQRARMRALQERRDLQDIVAAALEAYLRTPLKPTRRGEGRR